MKKRVFLSLFCLICFAHVGITQEVDTSRVYQLDEVIVSSLQVRKETPVAFRNISSQQLSQSNTGQSLPFLFSGMPSVTLSSDGGNGIGYVNFRVRGTDGNRINITVDGVPLNDSESHGVFWVNMADFASSVDQAQIQRGAGTSTNGAAAFGATVSMKSQKPSLKPYAEISSSFGSFNTFSETFKGGTGMLWDHFIFDARYSKVNTDGYIDRAKVDMSSYYGSAAYYNGGTMIKLQTFGSAEVTYQAWNGVDGSKLENDRRYNSCGEYKVDGVTKFYDNQTDNYWQHHYHLLTTQRFSDHLDLQVTLHYTDGKGYYEDYKKKMKYAHFKLPDMVTAEGKKVKATDMVRRKWLRNDFYGGLFRLNYTDKRLKSTLGGSINNYVGDHFGRVIWMKNGANLPDPDYEYYRNRGTKLDYSTYLKASYQFTHALNGYVDLQYRGIDYRIKGSDDKAGDNVNLVRQFNFFNPKAGVSYIHNGHQAYGLFAVAHREPNRKNFTENGPEESPTFERLYDWELGYNYTSSRFEMALNGYYMKYDNQLILTGKISEIGEALTSNIKDSYRLGVELTTAVQLLPSLRWEGNMTLSQNKIRNYTEYVDTFDPEWSPLAQTVNELGTTDIAFSPSTIINSLWEFRLKRFSASLTTGYVGRQYLDNTSSESRSIDPYLVSNLRVGYVFHPPFMREAVVDLYVNNLFNQQYETNGWVWSHIVGGERQQSAGYFTQAGTHFMGRVVLKF